MRKRDAILMRGLLTTLLLAFVIAFGVKMFAADYEQTENFGVKKPGDKVGFTATPPGTVISGAVTDPGGFVWTGSLAKWAATIPIDFSGLHSGLFNGEYVPKGDGGEPRTFTWQVDTHATVPKLEITKCPDKMLVEGKFELEAKAAPETEGQKYDWSFEGKGKGEFAPNPSEDGKTEFTAKEITSPDSESFVKVKYAEAEDKKEVKITRCEYFKKIKGGRGPASTQLAPYIYTHLCGVSKQTTIVKAYATTFEYELHDQYRKELYQTIYGGAFPYVKETINELKNNFWMNIQYTKDWEYVQYVFDDFVEINVGWDAIKKEDDVRLFNVAIDIDHTWFASVEKGKHSIPIITNNLTSYYIYVFRDEETGDLYSFLMRTIYILDFDTMM